MEKIMGVLSVHSRARNQTCLLGPEEDGGTGKELTSSTLGTLRRSFTSRDGNARIEGRTRPEPGWEKKKKGGEVWSSSWRLGRWALVRGNRRDSPWDAPSLNREEHEGGIRGFFQCERQRGRRSPLKQNKKNRPKIGLCPHGRERVEGT